MIGGARCAELRPSVSTSKEKRICPVVGREISSAECGESRHSRYACPEECPFNPYSADNYDRLLELTDKVDVLQSKWLSTQAEVHQRTREEVQRLGSEASAEKIGMIVFDVLHYRRDSEGLTMIQRWEKQGFPGLKNDQRFFVKARAAIRLGFLEIHQVIDDREVIAVDLLEPGSPEVRVVDRALASRAVRFGTWLTWTYDMPHFRRTHGATCQVDSIQELSPLEVLEITLQHLGCPADVQERARWMAKRYLDVLDSLSAIRKVRALDAIIGRQGMAGHRPLAPLDPKLEALVAPRLRENPNRLEVQTRRRELDLEDGSDVDQALRMSLLRSWLNESIPALGGKTPREASMDPTLRPMLVHLVKDQVRSFDEANLRAGTTGDMNWALKDLSLDELIFPPPPWREAPERR